MALYAWPCSSRKRRPLSVIDGRQRSPKGEFQSFKDAIRLHRSMTHIKCSSDYVAIHVKMPM